VSLRWPAVWILGAGQCVYWGVLYYTFSVLLVPMRAEFGASAAAVAGAFSAGLGVNALLASRIGQCLDAGKGTGLLRYGAIAAAVLLLAWSFAASLAEVYFVWLGLGVSMACVLYETAFGLITRAIAEPARRMSALASVTIMGGLASTIFLPADGWGVVHLGWRTTLRILALVWLLTALVLESHALPEIHATEKRRRNEIAPHPAALPDRLRVALLGAPFVIATLAAMTLSTLVVPMLVDRGESIERAAWVLAAFGVMQLPGRLWLWRGGRTLAPAALLLAPLMLQSLGLLLLAAASNLWLAFIGVGTFGIGAGLHTLARPWIVPHLFGVAMAGRVNGAIARAQGVARASGPVVAASIYGRLGMTPLLVALSIALLLLCPIALRTASQALREQAA